MSIQPLINMYDLPETRSMITTSVNFHHRTRDNIGAMQRTEIVKEAHSGD